jgi:hypothetical protein
MIEAQRRARRAASTLLVLLRGRLALGDTRAALWTVHDTLIPMLVGSADDVEAATQIGLRASLAMQGRTTGAGDATRIDWAAFDEAEKLLEAADGDSVLRAIAQLARIVTIERERIA